MFYYEWSLTREFLKQYFTEKQNGYFLNGRLREVVAMREWIVPFLVKCFLIISLLSCFVISDSK